jgi:hypothetical protein
MGDAGIFRPRCEIFGIAVFFNITNRKTVQMYINYEAEKDY